MSKRKHYDPSKPLAFLPKFKVGDFVLVGNRIKSWMIKDIANTGIEGHYNQDRRIGYWFDQQPDFPVFEYELKPAIKAGDIVEILNLDKDQCIRVGGDFHAKTMIGMKFWVEYVFDSYPDGTLGIVLAGYDGLIFTETQVKIVEI